MPGRGLGPCQGREVARGWYLCLRRLDHQAALFRMAGNQQAPGALTPPACMPRWSPGLWLLAEGLEFRCWKVPARSAQPGPHFKEGENDGPKAAGGACLSQAELKWVLIGGRPWGETSGCQIKAYGV